jgi:hypothetical protein
VLLEHIFFDKNIIPYRSVSLYHSQHVTRGIQKIFGTAKFSLLALVFFTKIWGIAKFLSTKEAPITILQQLFPLN